MKLKGERERERESQVYVFHLLVKVGFLPFYEHGFVKLNLILNSRRVQDLYKGVSPAG